MKSLHICFHRIYESEKIDDVSYGQLWISVWRFKLIIKCIQSLGYEFVRPDDSRFRGNEKIATVSFDDGYIDNAIVLSKVADELRIPIGIFVSTGYLLRDTFPTPTDLKVESIDKDKVGGILLTPLDLEKLSRFIWIGSHGHQHLRPVNFRSVQDFRDDLKKSLEILNCVVEPSQLVSAYAIPYGDDYSFETIHFDVARDVGFTSVFSCCFRFPVLGVFPRLGFNEKSILFWLFPLRLLGLSNFLKRQLAG